MPFFTPPIWDIKNKRWLRFKVNDADGNVMEAQHATPEQKNPQFVGSWQSPPSTTWPRVWWTINENNQKFEYKVVPPARLMRCKEVLLGLPIVTEILTQEGHWQSSPVSFYEKEEKPLGYHPQPIFYDDEVSVWERFIRQHPILKFFKENTNNFFTLLDVTQKNYVTQFIIEPALSQLRYKVRTYRAYVEVLQAIDKGNSASLPEAKNFMDSFEYELNKSTTVTVDNTYEIEVSDYPLARARMRAWILGAIHSELQSMRDFSVSSSDIAQLIHRQNIQLIISPLEEKPSILIGKEQQLTMAEWKALMNDSTINSPYPFQAFLKNRWEKRVEGSPLCYPHNLHHPMNQFCFALATSLSLPQWFGGGNKQALLLLMPSIKQLEDEVSLRDIDAKADLLAELRRFVVSDDGARAIYIESSLGGMSEDGRLKHTSAPFEPLSEEEQLRVIHHSVKSEGYYDVSKALADAKTKGPSFGASLNVLSKQLFAGSRVGGRQGTPEVASDPALVACREFKVFFDGLNKKDKTFLSGVSSPGLSRNFGQLWRHLQIYAGLIIPEEKERVPYDPSSRCSLVLSGNIDQIIEHNKLYDLAPTREDKHALPDCTMLELKRQDVANLFSKALEQPSYKVTSSYKNADAKLIVGTVKSIQELIELSEVYDDVYQITSERFLRTLVRNIEDLQLLLGCIPEDKRLQMLNNLFPPIWIGIFGIFPRADDAEHCFWFPKNFSELISVLQLLTIDEANSYIIKISSYFLKNLIREMPAPIQDYLLSLPFKSRILSLGIFVRAQDLLFGRAEISKELILFFWGEFYKQHSFLSYEDNIYKYFFKKFELALLYVTNKNIIDVIKFMAGRDYGDNVYIIIQILAILNRGWQKIFWDNFSNKKAFLNVIHRDEGNLLYQFLCALKKERLDILGEIYTPINFFHGAQDIDYKKKIFLLLPEEIQEQCILTLVQYFQAAKILHRLTYSNTPTKCRSMTIYNYHFFTRLINNNKNNVLAMLNSLSAEDQYDFTRGADRRVLQYISDSFFKERDDLLEFIARCEGGKVLALITNRSSTIPATLLGNGTVKETLAYLRKWKSKISNIHCAPDFHREFVHAVLRVYMKKRYANEEKYSSRWGSMFGYSRAEKIEAGRQLSQGMHDQSFMFWGSTPVGLESGDLGRIYKEARYQFRLK